MNIATVGLFLTGIGVIGCMIIIKEYMKKGFANKNDVLFSRVLLILMAVGIMLMAIGWAGLIT